MTNYDSSRGGRLVREVYELSRGGRLARTNYIKRLKQRMACIRYECSEKGIRTRARYQKTIKSTNK